MSENKKLQAVQADLESRGVHDVKFYFAMGKLAEKPRSDVASDAAAFLGGYVDGSFRQVDRVEDTTESKSV